MLNKLKVFFARLFSPKPSDQVVIGKEPGQQSTPGIVYNEPPRGGNGDVKPQWNAPWVFVDLDLLGLKEDNPKVAARYVPEWKHYGLDYKDLISADHAWCMMGMNKAFRDVGIKGTGSAAASSLQKWGRLSAHYFGAALPVEHKNGKHHVNFFLYWWDEAKKIACTLDRNRDNTFGVFLTDLSGSGDHLVPGPRWPLDTTIVGCFPTKKQVLAVYPNFIPSGSSHSGTTGSTR